MPTSTEISPNDIATALKQVRDQKTFLNTLLAETLNWPVNNGVSDVEDISYEWSDAELRARDLSKKLIAGRVLQVQLAADQPWGIFILEFASDQVFTADRGMTGVLRQVLRGLVKNRNKPGSLPSWGLENLLFICTHKYEHFRIAHFKAPKEDGRTARLAAFGWGPDIPARTACEFNLNHLGWPDAVDGFDHWTEAFNVEKVTKKFYREYSDQFDALRKAVKGFGSDTEDQKMFTQTLLNRLMFLRFIERKGWLTPPGDSTGRDYLRLLFNAGNYRGKSFYTGRVRKLFFEGLAVEGKQESESIGKVPFLNGGLFEENALDEKVDDIPNKAFEPLLGPEGLFYRYNFTVQESTPLDVEVAVDPEMLGKVFEELVTGRHESGSYYTPRPVVSFMCREALKGYLADVSKLPETTVAAFVDKHDTGAIDIAGAQALVAALNNLKAVDPACGSGAYLLGLLHEMVDLYRLLYSEKLNHSDDKLHDLKLRIISNSIYGVDIDKFATNIAMLRLWLSLSVDSKKPLPLPNLEFKIETGDSLTGPDPSAMPDLFRQQLQRRADLLVKLKDKYLKTHDRSKHDQLEVIRKEEREIAKGLNAQVGEGVIDWRIHFAEVFAGEPPESTMEGFFPQMNRTPKAQMSFTVGEQRGGFDIVLANPPYVRMELIAHLKPQLRTIYPEVFAGRADLYCYFYQRATQLLRNRGMLVIISSNKWFRGNYGVGLRKFVAERLRIESITDFGELPVFESVATFPMIFVAQKSHDDSPPIFTQVASLSPPYPDVLALIAESGQRLPRGAIAGSSWKLGSSSVLQRIQKMESAGARLVDHCAAKIYSGIKTGFNDAFWIDGAIRQALISQDRSASRIIKPLLRGDDIRRWHLKNNDLYIIYTTSETDIDDYPSVKRHLRQFKEKLEARAVQQPWWELQQAQNKEGVWQNPKILYPDICRESRFALDFAGIYADMKGFLLPTDDTYLLGVLNSSTVWWFLQQHCAVLGDPDNGGRLQLKRQYVEKVPIPDASAADRKVIGALAQKCLDAKGIGCESWEREIDERVSALYGL